MAKSSMKEMIDKELNFIEPDVENGWKNLQIKMKKSKVKETQIKHSTFKKPLVTVVSILLFMISVSPVLAYEYYKTIYKVPKLEQRIVSEDISLTNDVIVVESENKLAMENIQIEYTGQGKKENGIILTFRLKTKDGSPLMKDDLNKAPVYTPFSFESVTISVNNKSKKFPGTYLPYEQLPKDYYIGCIATAEDYSYADFEIYMLNDYLQLQDEVVTIQFDNLVGTYHAFKDIKTVGTLGDILGDYSAGENLHIPFSEEYPLCYIDSYHFEKDDIFDNPEKPIHIFPHGKKMFTMTVVCDDASKEEICNMAFQNINTGLNGIAETQTKELEDGRLQFYYSVNYDGSYVNETQTSKGGSPRDTTPADLQYLVLKLGGECTSETILEGTIVEKIILK